MIEPLSIQPLDAEYALEHAERVMTGKAFAKGKAINVVAIARNACPHLANTFACLDALRPHFGSMWCYFFENDSTDDTAIDLDLYAASRPDVVVEHATLSRPDYRGWEQERTTFLAQYRNRCLDYVKSTLSDAEWTIVLDVDPHGGFYVDGVFTSIYWLTAFPIESGAGAMASYSIVRQTGADGEHLWAHYDAYAARPVSWWRDRKAEIGMSWFSHFIPPIGSRPNPMNSAFGGLCVYRTEAYLCGARYGGGDCEHVVFHRGLNERGWRLYLNPGSVYAAIVG